MRLGIVGLPNVGKSTLFNALTRGQVEVAKYPFSTLEAQVGQAPLFDPRLRTLAQRLAPRRPVPTTVTFTDLAGLVKGASQGQGLGNQFLAKIREVDAIVHVLRAFDVPDVAHVMGTPDPVRDLDVVETELALADLEWVERRLEGAERRAKGNEPDARAEVELLGRLAAVLAEGQPFREVRFTAGEQARLPGYALLTLKPVLYLLNVAEGDLTGPEPPAVGAVRAAAGVHPVVVLCGKLEEELSRLEEADREAFLEELRLGRPRTEELVARAYELLGLVTFYTVGEEVVQAWSVRRGTRAPEAAGRIHSDMARGFIAAEVLPFEQFLQAGSPGHARELGQIHIEGRGYEIQDGDIVHFRFQG